MDFREVTKSWLKGLRVAGLLVLGFPTLGLAWMVLSEGMNEKHDRRLLIYASEDWVECWRRVVLIILGFVTFGYTWVMACKLDIVVLSEWRKRWINKEVT